MEHTSVPLLLIIPGEKETINCTPETWGGTEPFRVSLNQVSQLAQAIYVRIVNHPVGSLDAFSKHHSKAS